VGRLVRRNMRFFAAVALDGGQVVTAHCVNTGSMKGCAPEGARVWISEATNPARKLRWTWEIVDVGATLVGINTALPNVLAERAIAGGLVPELAGFATTRREVRYGTGSRVDLLLEDPTLGLCYVEVKNVTLEQDGVALFPDSPSERGTKHLRELLSVVEQGHRAAMLYVVQRTDCEAVAPAEAIDPLYARTLREVTARGVAAFAMRFRVTPSGIAPDRPLPVLLGPRGA
jgi:sugar fermentation stimulation protein A